MNGQIMEKYPLELTVNGKAYRAEIEHRKTLADTIREDCGLTGTHVGCEHGVCGACTVLVDGKPVRSCLLLAHQAGGSEIRTVESLAEGDVLHPLQQAFIDNHALQCGFCTPGFLMLVVGAFESDPDIAEAELIELLSSNLCRCTGYQNIVKAVRSVAPQLAASPRGGGKAG
jgi:carbon-monoxide dehydrogenase small subunit